MTKLLLEPSFEGKRFEKHTFPLELLKDFSALEEMIIAVAKHLYLNDQPNLKRLPQGRFKNIELHLSGIKEGSAIALIQLDEKDVNQLFTSEIYLYIQKAIDSVIDTIQRIGAGLESPLPPTLLRHFDKFGRGLRSDEKISFTDRQQNKVVLTPELRKKILITSKIDSWTEEESHKALISEMDKVKKQFSIRLLNGEIIKAPFDENIKATVQQAFEKFEHKQYVQIKGIVRYSHPSIRKEFESIDLVELLDPLDIDTRLDEISLLTQGWLDGTLGEPIKTKHIEQTKDWFNNFYQDNLPLPHLYPTPEGGIQAEWTVDKWNISFELNFTESTYHYLAYNANTNKVDEWENSFEEVQAAWSKLNQSLQKIISGE